MFNAPFFRQIEFYDSYYENLNKFLPEEVKTKLSDRIEEFRTFRDEQGPIIEPIFGHSEYDYDDVTMQTYSEDFLKKIDKKLE